ncbi:leucine-rich repeat domain-containing protein [Lachnospiraceae bacterium MD1]|uniref:Leucine-rich repeat domain-containing protein n=1 Tax=Variimorphobacter saccharofermentans TaxID=2755051 RepID=A0A839JVX0_9FIRM|nr:leucine-rich repeat domain-containing protein [Variimorphobacter saccharofermentans]MBB2181803.1 leucine-rich repeat domain-containing protein [Variimorphobacter saccharofermentans]
MIGRTDVKNNRNTITIILLFAILAAAAFLTAAELAVRVSAEELDWYDEKVIETFKQGGIKYFVTKKPKGTAPGEAYVGGCEDSVTKLVIKGRLKRDSNKKEYTVKGIVDGAFQYNQRITSLKITPGLRDIGANAFSGCVNLKKAELDGGITKIGKDAFWQCGKLEGIRLPSGLTYLGAGAFSQCVSITEIDLPKGVKRIYPNTFAGCDSVTKVKMHNAVTHIDEMAFYDCKKLEKLTLSKNLAYIGDAALCCCERLTAVELPFKLKTLGKSAFASCTALKNIVIPENVVSIGEACFRNCATLRSITMGNKVTKLESEFCYDCEALESIKLSSKLETIENSAFYGCKQLKTVDLPATLKSIGRHAFHRCEMLDGISLPKSLEKIEYGAFSNAGLSSITIPGKVKVIEGCAFDNNRRLEKVVIQEGTERIEEYCFANCIELSEIEFPSTVNYIGCGALDYTAWYKVFEDPYLSYENLETKFIDHVMVNDILVFISGYKLAYNEIDTSAGIMERSTYLLPKEELVIPENTRMIYSINCADRITKSGRVILNEGLEIIGKRAFYDSSALTELILPESVTEIGSEAFWNTGMKEISLPDGIQKIASDFFVSQDADSELIVRVRKNSRTHKELLKLMKSEEVAWKIKTY